MLTGEPGYVTVYFKNTNDLLTNISLEQMLFLFGDPDGFTSKRVVDAWTKNGVWNFEVSELDRV